MGHLINPVAFRLGWTKNWVDTYYVTNSYYPQFLHMILRLRLFLNYFFKQPALVKLGFFFSHFTIANILGTLAIHVFYYDSRVEAAWNNYLHSSFPMELRHELAIYDRFVFRRFYFLFILLLLINSLVATKVDTKYVTRSFFKRQINYGKKFKMPNSFSKSIFCLFSNFLRNYFLGFLFYNKSYGKKRGKRASWDYVSFAQNIFFAGLSYLLVRPFFYHLSNFLNFLLGALAPSFMSRVHFYLISNDHVNASFLSNYIARRLKQGYRLGELINPLRRELKRLKKSHTTRFRKLVGKSQAAGKSLRINYTSIFSHVLFRLFGFFRKNLAQSLGHNYTLASYEFLFIAFSLLKSHFKIRPFSFSARSSFKGTYKNIANSHHLKSKSVCRRISGIFRTLTNRQAQSLFFYKVTQANFYSKYVFLGMFFPKTRTMMERPDYYFFLREVIDSFLAGYSLVSTTYNLSLVNCNISLLSIYKSFSIGFQGFLRYTRFSLLKFNMAHYFHRMGVNKKNARGRTFRRQYGLLGFKFHLKGRFTRKQIAASHIFRRGPLPLSTLNINLDYSFSTIAIKNSAVGIKVWLYKADNFYNFYFKTI